MAIEVVKEGNRNLNEQFHVECSCCGTVINFLRGDGYNDAKTCVECPRCKKLIYEEKWKKGEAPDEAPDEVPAE